MVGSLLPLSNRSGLIDEERKKGEGEKETERESRDVAHSTGEEPNGARRQTSEGRVRRAGRGAVATATATTTSAAAAMAEATTVRGRLALGRKAENSWLCAVAQEDRSAAAAFLCFSLMPRRRRQWALGDF